MGGVTSEPEPFVTASQARTENNNLASKAKQVSDTAEEFVNDDSTASDVEAALQAESDLTSNVDAIEQWTSIDPDFYDYTQNNEPSEEAAEYVLEVAESNQAVIEQSRGQLQNQIESVSSTDTDFLVDAATQMINANQDELPSLAKMLFGSEKMNVHVSMPSGAEVVVYLETEEARVVESHAGKDEEARLKVMMDSETLREIIGSDEPGEVFKQAILDDEIKYKGLTTVTWAITGVVSTIEDFVGDWI